MRKIGITWDGVPVPNIDIAAFRNDAFDVFREHATKSNRLTKNDLSVSNLELLNSLDLMTDTYIKRAGILLFHQNPEKWVPGSYIKIGYFKTDSDLIYQDELHGSLLAQADRVMDCLYTKYLKAVISYDGITRVEKYPYPKEALREAVLNAIIHKDYASATPIQISVYEEKIYIANDGRLPEGWTVESLFQKHKSKAYNPFIAGTFFRTGMIEVWGRGIEKMRFECALWKCGGPIFTLYPDDVMVMFHAQSAQPDTALEAQVIKALLADGNMSQAEIARALNVEYEAVRSIIRRLKRLGRIVRLGSNRKGMWRLVR